MRCNLGNSNKSKWGRPEMLYLKPHYRNKNQFGPSGIYIKLQIGGHKKPKKQEIVEGGLKYSALQWKYGETLPNSGPHYSWHIDQ
ncbi:hypothetical protein PoB_004359600 [Plakobranchus ocellatus]|uniref:Uncharacterized protein n=1 Tax=Plakobranchus ocellatus TaxID=259542 RepID=A0AAV4B9G4_9GAST|nr:hypothetical protein PoB_004359600 [Plakobranchus ocellatus]